MQLTLLTKQNIFIGSKFILNFVFLPSFMIDGFFVIAAKTS